MSNQNRSEKRTSGPCAAVLNEVKQHLEDVRLKLHDEISTYPRPITACDAQFNYLLEKRTQLGSELGMVEELLSQLEDSAVDMSMIEAFVASSDNLDRPLAEKLISAFR